MKKRIWIPLAIILFLAVLFLPIPRGSYDDGGTWEYRALTYRIVKWNRLTENGIYQKTRVYFGFDCFQSLDTLWASEQPSDAHSFYAKVRKISGNTVTVEPLEGEQVGGLLTFGAEGLEFTAQVGETVYITFTGVIRETYPGQIDVTEWTKFHHSYPRQWMDKEGAQKQSGPVEEHLIIREIYADCFIAEPMASSFQETWEIKVNGSISSKWRIGDKVRVICTNIYLDKENWRMECDLQSIETSILIIKPSTTRKPVIYLYPQEKTEVSVKLEYEGVLTCTYPAYQDGWTVTAQPDGTLTDAAGKLYNYLYWEGETLAQWDMETGFCVKGEDTAAFLEEALAKLGLNRREANEVIIYWLPQMQENPYNIISFQGAAYTDAARLEITPSPDTLIRVFMAYRPSAEAVDIEPQVLTAPKREGFTVVEWGGTELQ